MAEDGKKLELGDFYSERMSFEEVSNYGHDLKIQLPLARQGDVNLATIQKELVNAWRIARMTSRHLRLVDPKTLVTTIEIISNEEIQGQTLGFGIRDPKKT